MRAIAPRQSAVAGVRRLRQLCAGGDEMAVAACLAAGTAD
jgi:hypothetical protein